LSKKILQKLASWMVSVASKTGIPDATWQLLVYLCAENHHPSWSEEYGHYLDPGKGVMMSMLLSKGYFLK